MADIYKGELQDNLGNTVYPHTESDVVFCTDGKTVQEKLAGYENALGSVKGTSGSLEVNDANILATTEATKQLDEKFGGLDIRYNSETGKPEWKERGADTFIPFKSGAEKVIDTTFSRTATESTNYVVDEYFTIIHPNATNLTVDNFIVILTPTKISNCTGQTTWPQGYVSIPASPTVTYDASAQRLRVYQVMSSATTNGAAHWHYFGNMSFAIKVYVV